MPGKVLKILVSQGAPVTAGQLVLILEAMKMENEIYASVAGTVTQLGCKEGDSVNTGDTLLVIG
jgi:glutaconyl-CoA decarboxylase